MSHDILKSRSHPYIHRLRQIRDGKEKSLVFCEGWRLIQDLLRSSWTVKDIVCVESLKVEVESLLKTAPGRHFPVRLVSVDVMAFLSDVESPPGIIALAERPKSESSLPIRFSGESLVVILHQISNPQNLGNVLRTSEAAGVSTVFVTKKSADVYCPGTLRGSMGSAFRLIIRTDVELREVVDLVRQKGLTVYAAVQTGTHLYDEVNWKNPSALVMGSEATGFSKPELALFNETLRIPMLGGVESLNVGTAAAVCLYEAMRQRRRQK